jgi:hypothetical protein
MAFREAITSLRPEKKKKRMSLRARAYEIHGDNLYKSGVCAPLLKCISIDEGRPLATDPFRNVFIPHEN